MAAFYKIKNWDKYQHYKGRNPPWIRLYINGDDDIMDSLDWCELDDQGKLTMIVCLAVAGKLAVSGENDGIIPNRPQYIKKHGGLSFLPNLQPLVDCGFLIPDTSSEPQNCDTNVADLLAYRKQDASESLALQNNRLTESISPTTTESDTPREANVDEIVDKSVDNVEGDFFNKNNLICSDLISVVPEPERAAYRERLIQEIYANAHQLCAQLEIPVGIVLDALVRQWIKSWERQGYQPINNPAGAFNNWFKKFKKGKQHDRS